MYLCNCRRVGYGTTPSRLVDVISEGASRTRDVVEKDDVGNGCGGCRPRWAKLNSTIKDLAAERDASGMDWPSAEQRKRAEKLINDVAMKG